MGSRPRPRPRRRRAPLDRDAVIAEALALVDKEGVAQLSMRKLATRLGVEAMSLYNHVPSKQALLEGVADRAVSQAELPAADDDWRPWVREWVLRTRAVFLAHPRLFPALIDNALVGPSALGAIDALFVRLEQAGFSPEGRIQAWEVLKAYLFGGLVQLGLGGALSSVPAGLGRYPALVALLPAYRSFDFARSFETGLDLILAGLEP